MAEVEEDPREVQWHPRLTQKLVGHGDAETRIRRAFGSGKMHHAWLISGAQGIGKASLAYHFAGFVLASVDSKNAISSAGLNIDPQSRTSRWMASRAHPDLFVLERNWDGKTKKFKTRILVDDARKLSDFFNLTAGSSGWRVAIIDTADDLNMESANALLKHIEEPPPNCLLLLVCNQPGRLLRTIRSRCMRIDLQPLTQTETLRVLAGLPLQDRPAPEEMEIAARLSNGSPGRALDLISSAGAKFFAAFQQMGKITPATLVEFGNRFNAKSTSAEDFDVFCALLEGWTGAKARELALTGGGQGMAEAFSAIGHSIRQTNVLNLDRRQTVMHALSLIDGAMKTA